jgi:hypothetical protein
VEEKKHKISFGLGDKIILAVKFSFTSLSLFTHNLSAASFTLPPSQPLL